MQDTSYLYGTMHVQDKRVFDFKPGVLSSFDSCEIFALELNMDSVNPFQVMGQMIMDSSRTLSQLLNPKDYNVVKTYIEDSLGLPIMLLERLQPMFISTFVEGSGYNQEMEEALDLYFFKRGKDQEKQIVGLEKASEQIDAFNSIPYREQALDLLNMIQTRDEPDLDDEKSEELLNVYLSGDLDRLIALAKETQDESLDTSNFQKVFLTDRNINMTNRIIPLLKSGATFTAVGAAHLPGKDGIIELLRSQGFIVEPK